MLAAAWANVSEIREMGSKMSLCIVGGKKLMRRALDTTSVFGYESITLQ